MPSHSQDYVKRLVEEIGQVWAEIRALFEQNKTELAFDALDAAYRKHVRLDRDLVHKTSEDFLILSTAVGKVGEADRAIVLGDLLKIEAAMHDKTGNIEMRDSCLLKALSVVCAAYLKMHHSSTLGHIELIDELAAATADLERQPATNWRLLQVYEQRRLFDKAEDTLYDLVDADPAYIDQGIAFYERALALPDHILAEGGLPRDEAQDGLESLLDRE